MELWKCSCDSSLALLSLSAELSMNGSQLRLAENTASEQDSHCVPPSNSVSAMARAMRCITKFYIWADSSLKPAIHCQTNLKSELFCCKPTTWGECQNHHDDQCPRWLTTDATVEPVAATAYRQLLYPHCSVSLVCLLSATAGAQETVEGSEKKGNQSHCRAFEWYKTSTAMRQYAA